MKWLRWVFVYTGLLIMLFGCYNPDIERMGVTWIKRETPWNPASVCDYKVVFISTSYFRTMEHFYKNVQDTLKWLRKHDYEIVKQDGKDVRYIYGKDVTQKDMIKYAYIKYRQVKNNVEK